jgi:hypothetical protein
MWGLGKWLAVFAFLFCIATGTSVFISSSAKGV